MSSLSALSSRLSVNGLITGLDTDRLLEGMLAVKQAQISRLEAKQKDVLGEQTISPAAARDESIQVVDRVAVDPADVVLGRPSRHALLPQENMTRTPQKTHGGTPDQNEDPDVVERLCISPRSRAGFRMRPKIPDHGG